MRRPASRIAPRLTWLVLLLFLLAAMIVGWYQTTTMNNDKQRIAVHDTGRHEVIAEEEELNNNNNNALGLYPPALDVTFYATAKSIGVPQLTSIRSWLALGADVLMFVDDLEKVDQSLISTLTKFASEQGEGGRHTTSRIRFLSTPSPRSQAGSPRLDVVMHHGEHLARTEWVCLINADIVLPRKFGQLLTHLHTHDYMVIGSRHDCRFNPDLGSLPASVVSFEDLERYSMAPCWPHGVGGKDYFLYRKGYFTRRNIAILPFWIGKFVWDHWLVNVTREFCVDATPTIVIGHMSHNHYWTENLFTEDDRIRKRLIKVEIEHNKGITGCGSIPMPVCLKTQSVYDVKWQLCPDGVIQTINGSAHKALYNRAVSDYRLNKVKERRVYQNFSLTGSSPNYWQDQLERRIWPKLHGC